MRFRTRLIALNADIEAMYHMVRLPQSDTDSVRFFLQGNLRSTTPPDVYQFLVRIFGVVDSLYVAKTALDNTGQFSMEAVETVFRDWYVDDLLSSECNGDSVFSDAQENSNILASRSFRLKKWLSNFKTLLSKFNTGDCRNPDVESNFDYVPSYKALGLHWNTNDDDFYIVYKDDLKWDKNLDNLRKNAREEWTESLKQLTNFHVPRQYLGASKTAIYEICDASEQAYVAVAHLRAKKCQCVNYSLSMAKSIVSPMKFMSVSKLELQSALLAAPDIINSRPFLLATTYVIQLPSRLNANTPLDQQRIREDGDKPKQFRIAFGSAGDERMYQC